MGTERGSSSSSFTPRWTYDVFLSFRGEDTRNGFTDHLYVALQQSGIFTFKDDEKLERGKSISLELLKAIEESKFAIVILSSNYASSTWCLDELVKIIGCMKETGMVILPVFYHVNPSDVRNQTGTFAQAFDQHKEENIEKVQTWRATLKEVTNLSGWHLQDGPETKCIKDIMKEILNYLNRPTSIDTKELIGIKFRVEKLKSHLAIESNDVRYIGIWGTGGMGKTTLARAVYDMFSNKFEACSFIANVREESGKRGLRKIQQILLKELSNDRDLKVQDVDKGVRLIKNKLRNKKILLVLDDVNELDQLKKLAGENCWFGSGSRVIITTRDRHLLVTHEVKEIYEAEVLNNGEDLQLFSLNAFKMDHPPKDYVELSLAFVQYSKGLPLALEVLGSFLFSLSIDEWKSELDRLKEFPKTEILNVLQISFKGLQDVEKDIFLNIACLYNHHKQDDVIKILDYLGLHAKIGLRVLIDKSLIKLNGNRLWMHELLQEMGQYIVCQESKDPGKRSILWSFNDIDNVLTKNTGTEAIQSIVLELYKPKEVYEPKKVYWNPEAFSKMQDLKLLKICGVQLMHDLKHLPNSLRFLDWRGYPSKSLTSSFQSKSFQLLKFVRLKESLKLIETSNFSKIPNLEKLVLEGCINLRSLHQSIGDHKKLTLLNLKGCINLRSLPNKFEMDSLETLIFSGCSNLRRISEFGEDMKSLLEIGLDGTAITKLPTSIGNLTGLKSLNVKDCKNLLSLPSTFFNMKLLQSLDFSGCSKLLENFGTAVSVEELDVSGRQMASSNALFETLKKVAFGGFELLPFYSKPRSSNPADLSLTSLSCFCSLTKLKLSYCNLNAIPIDICRLSSLNVLFLSGNHFDCLPESISQLSSLFRLVVENCKSLRSLPKLPLCVSHINLLCCTSLETIPDLLRPISLKQRSLWISDCSKLDDNQGLVDLFFARIKDNLQGHEEMYYSIIIPGRQIPKWFSHQNTGNEVEVNIEEPSSHLCNEWMGIAVCVAFCPQNNNKGRLICDLIVNGKKMSSSPASREIVVLSNNIWLLYVARNSYLREHDVNGFSQIGIKIRHTGFNMKKCGLRLVYKRDAEDFNQFMA